MFKMENSTLHFYLLDVHTMDFFIVSKWHPSQAWHLEL
jgi:hypothetical protein